VHGDIILSEISARSRDVSEKSMDQESIWVSNVDVQVLSSVRH